jgi:uncharacterized protein
MRIRIEELNEIQEQVVLAFPLRTFCKPDCRGLCPQCGADLNSEECDCDQTPHAGKFAVFKNLKIDKGLFREQKIATPLISAS